MVQICNKNGLIVGRLEWSELVFQNGPRYFRMVRVGRIPMQL